MTLDARRALVDTIGGRLAELGVDELRVLDRIAARLQIGQRQYGELDIATDARDWTEEALQEALDLSVYLAIKGARP
jgi:hypothetical protein